MGRWGDGESDQFSRFPIPDSRFPTPDSRFPIPDSRFPIPDSRFPIPDSRFFVPFSKSVTLSTSLIPPVQDLLLESRLLLQAGYRQVTQQVQWQANPSPVKSPVRLVQIDNKSLEQDNVKLVDGRYMDYGYLASILDKLVTSNARIIGFDYILDQDKQQPDNSKRLRQSITEAINNNTWLVWAAIEAEHPADYYGVSDQIANLNQTMEGDITTYDWYVELPSNNCDQSCP
ncbi:MAG: CHASE2 domain-containing protein, partial [Moorea sp. SIO3I7]|nr:CHASE2 domain-containing protein [Moorena sp. SIO3I7]